VAAVADELRLLGLREDDVHDLPVTLVRLPDEVAWRVGVRVGVVVVEVPVLEHDRARRTDDSCVDDARTVSLRAFSGITGEPADRKRRRARILVQPPRAGAGSGELAELRIRVDERPGTPAELLQVGVSDERLDAGRAELLRLVELQDRLVLVE
jgi:hypothetical protein